MEIPLAIIFVPVIHMYKQLRGTYQISRIGAFLRTIFLAGFCFCTATIFFIMLLAIGALGLRKRKGPPKRAFPLVISFA